MAHVEDTLGLAAAVDIAFTVIRHITMPEIRDTLRAISQELQECSESAEGDGDCCEDEANIWGELVYIGDGDGDTAELTDCELGFPTQADCGKTFTEGLEGA